MDATSAGDVVFGDGDFHLGVVGEGQYVLYQAFAEGTLSDDDTPVVVLDGAGEDFAGRGAAAVDEDGQGDLLVDGLVGGGIQVIGVLCLAFGRHHGFAFRNEEVDNIDCLIEEFELLLD